MPYTASSQCVLASRQALDLSIRASSYALRCSIVALSTAMPRLLCIALVCYRAAHALTTAPRRGVLVGSAASVIAPPAFARDEQMLRVGQEQPLTDRDNVQFQTLPTRRQGSTIKARRRRVGRPQQHNRRRGDGSTPKLERRAVLLDETPRRRRCPRRRRALYVAARHRVGGARTGTGPPGRQEERDPTHHRPLEPRLFGNHRPRARPADDRGQARPRQQRCPPSSRRGAELI